VEDFMKDKSIQVKKSLIENKREINGVNVISSVIASNPNMVRDIVFQIRGEITENLLIIIGSNDCDKPMLTVSVSEDLTSKYNAGQLVRDASKLIQGGGGGQAHYATAGGKNSEKLQDAVNCIIEKL
jgi:alanyl-tRNA synthetase